mmetsp:Transcript_103538/g.270335  ORF Transcript_103538/g.270335 Transcript_103538/m.270335 type:complete len:212 (+) Transcript_103538:2294-2929(+)
MIPKLAPLTWWCPPPPENSEPARRFGQTHTGKRLLFEGSPCRQSSRHRPMLRTPLRRLFLFCRGAGASKHGCRHSQPACGTSAPLPAPAPVPASLGPLPAAPRPSPRGLPARRVRCAQPDSRTRSRPEVSSPSWSPPRGRGARRPLLIDESFSARRLLHGRGVQRSLGQAPLCHTALGAPSCWTRRALSAGSLRTIVRRRGARQVSEGRTR